MPLDLLVCRSEGGVSQVSQGVGLVLNMNCYSAFSAIWGHKLILITININTAVFLCGDTDTFLACSLLAASGDGR